jgi:hypothetical protein
MGFSFGEWDGSPVFHNYPNRYYAVAVVDFNKGVNKLRRVSLP